MRSMGSDGEENYNYMADKLYEAARSTEGTSMKTFVAEDSEDDGVFFHRLTPGDQSNALHVAAQHGNSDFISALLLARISTNPHELVCKHNSKGETPLHLAAQSGCKETVQALLHAHDHDKSLLACWRERNNQGDTPLHIALRYGHDEIALLILERDLELVSIYNNVGESLAYLAAENFCPNFLQRILDADRHGLCTVSFSGPFGQTAFHPASKLNEDIMSILIERRKHLLKVQDNKGKTVLHYAVEEHNESMVETLLEADSYLAYFHDKDGFTPLHIAARRGFLPIIQTILELSPQSIVVRDKHHGKTALHVAKMDAVFLRGCLKKTRMKELVNEVDNDGNTLLHLALIHSDLEIADTLLLTSSINWRLKNKLGNSPKDLCKSDDQIPIRLKCFASAWRTKESVDMEIFYDKQVTNLDDLSNYYKSWDQCLNFQGPGENSILHIAARDGKMKIIDQARKSKSACRMLLLGKNFKGETPLHMAAEYGHLRFVKAILSVCTQTDIFGSGRKFYQSASVIEKGEANDEMEDFKPWKFKAKNGDTPVHKAMRNGHSGTALFLLRLEPELASFVNKANESLLYLAADQGCSKVGKEILSASRAYPFSISGPDGKNPLHAAAAASKRGYHIGVHLMKRRPDLLSMVDNEGKTPLHYAAEKAKPSLVSQLIKQDKSTAFVYDKEGFTPLLRAAISGSYMGIEAILEGCPLSAELRDVSNNRTVLHLIAAKSSYGLQKCLNHKNMVKLINEIDRDGNTPLHSAVLEADKRKVIALFKAKGVNRRIRNKQHQMPMDLCEKLMGNGNEQQAEIHKSFKRMETGVVSPIEWIRHRIGRVGSIPTDVKLLREEELKQLLNNLALVATLLVTLTFAALFTIPGGYDQTTGKALRMKQVAIQVFVASDAVAMLLGIAVLLGYTSAISTGYHVYLEDIASSSVTMLQYSLRATVLAFLCGVYALVSNVAIWIIILAVVVTARVAFFPWI